MGLTYTGRVCVYRRVGENACGILPNMGAPGPLLTAPVSLFGEGPAPPGTSCASATDGLLVASLLTGGRSILDPGIRRDGEPQGELCPHQSFPLSLPPPPPHGLPLPASRTTAFGFLNALCKLAAVLGISIFTSFVGITKAVPILLASAALAVGSSLALKLPETRGQVLQ